MLKGGDTPFEQRLLLLGVVVGRVLREITILGGGADLRGHLLAAHVDQVRLLRLDLRAALRGEEDGLLIHCHASSSLLPARATWMVVRPARSAKR